MKNVLDLLLIDFFSNSQLLDYRYSKNMFGSRIKIDTRIYESKLNFFIFCVYSTITTGISKVFPLQSIVVTRRL